MALLQKQWAIIPKNPKSLKLSVAMGNFNLL